MNQSARYPTEWLSAAARSTRHEIANASYQTTPSHTPPGERECSNHSPRTRAANLEPTKSGSPDFDFGQLPHPAMRSRCYLDALQQQGLKKDQKSGGLDSLPQESVVLVRTSTVSLEESTHSRTWSWDYQEFKHKMQLKCLEEGDRAKALRRTSGVAETQISKREGTAVQRMR